MAYSPFVPLRVFSSFTMLEGAIEPKAIAKAARERGFPAIAVADRNGLYGVMAFGDACKAAGIQPIVGALLSVARPGQRLARKRGVGARDTAQPLPSPASTSSTSPCTSTDAPSSMTTRPPMRTRAVLPTTTFAPPWSSDWNSRS